MFTTINKDRSIVQKLMNRQRMSAEFPKSRMQGRKLYKYSNASTHCINAYSEGRSFSLLGNFFKRFKEVTAVVDKDGSLVSKDRVWKEVSGASRLRHGKMAKNIQEEIHKSRNKAIDYVFNGNLILAKEILTKQGNVISQLNDNEALNLSTTETLTKQVNVISQLNDNEALDLSTTETLTNQGNVISQLTDNEASDLLITETLTNQVNVISQPNDNEALNLSIIKAFDTIIEQLKIDIIRFRKHALSTHANDKKHPYLCAHFSEEVATKLMESDMITNLENLIDRLETSEELYAAHEFIIYLQKTKNIDIKAYSDLRYFIKEKLYAKLHVLHIGNNKFHGNIESIHILQELSGLLSCIEKFSEHDHSFLKRHLDPRHKRHVSECNKAKKTQEDILNTLSNRIHCMNEQLKSIYGSADNFIAIVEILLCISALLARNKKVYQSYTSTFKSDFKKIYSYFIKNISINKEEYLKSDCHLQKINEVKNNILLLVKQSKLVDNDDDYDFRDFTIERSLKELNYLQENDNIISPNQITSDETNPKQESNTSQQQHNAVPPQLTGELINATEEAHLKTSTT